MIAQCLQAVAEQRCTDYDVYVCDNHSTDDSEKVIEDFIKQNRLFMGNSG
jgi:glycosyltransferase involved in cell wall biosynthesis